MMRALPILVAAVCLLAAHAAPIVVPATDPADYPQKPDGHYLGPQEGPHGYNKTFKTSVYIVQTSPQAAIHAGLIPGSDDMFIYMSRPIGGAPQPPPFKEYLVGTFDLPKREFVNVTVDGVVFCGGMVPTHDGKILFVGGSGKSANGMGDGRKHVRIFDVDQNPEHLQLVANMSAPRWYPTPTLLPNNKVMIHGGTIATSETSVTAPYYEVWDPANPAAVLEKFDIEETYLNATVQDFYPFNFVLPTGEVWSMQNNETRIIKEDGSYRMDPNDPTKPLVVTGFPEDVLTQYPRSGSSLMLPLTFEDNYSSVEIVVSGGTPSSQKCDWDAGAFSIASRRIFRIKVTWKQNGDDWDYTFGPWVEEDMAIARAGGDSTLLPNGDFIISNGGQTGCPGGTQAGHNRNHFPAFWPVLYQPDLPKDKRVTILPASPLARMYHNTATLTRDGNLLIGGCDACGAGHPPSPDGKKPANGLYRGMDENALKFWLPSPFGRHELRDELYSTPYGLDFAEQPYFKTLKGDADGESVVDITYGETFTIEWVNGDKTRQDLVPVTKVALVAPSTSTHAFNTNQRVVFLEMSAPKMGADSGSVEVTIPDNINVAPPQYYMLFLMQEKTYGRSRWVNLQPKKAAA